MKDKPIYRDFNHWFSTSKAHGMSSCSRDWMESIWNDILPTIQASQDDYKNSYLAMMREQARGNCELVDAMLEYIKEHKQKGQKTFWCWWSDKVSNKR